MPNLQEMYDQLQSAYDIVKITAKPPSGGGLIYRYDIL